MLLCRALPALPRPSCACSTGWPWLGSLYVAYHAAVLHHYVGSYVTCILYVVQVVQAKFALEAWMLGSLTVCWRVAAMLQLQKHVFWKICHCAAPVLSNFHQLHLRGTSFCCIACHCAASVLCVLYLVPLSGKHIMLGTMQLWFTEPEFLSVPVHTVPADRGREAPGTTLLHICCWAYGVHTADTWSPH